jgi:Na+-transporting NADH:ubiquinone oxidoreductase subunit F
VLPYFQEFLRDPAHTEAYLCGSPGMLNAAVKKLKELGITDDRIFYDSFA